MPVTWGAFGKLSQAKFLSVNHWGLRCPSANNGAGGSKHFIGTRSIFRQCYGQSEFADAAIRRTSKSFLNTRFLWKKKQRACRRSLQVFWHGRFIVLRHYYIFSFLAFNFLLTVSAGVGHHWMTRTVRGVFASASKMVTREEVKWWRGNAFLYL